MKNLLLAALLLLPAAAFAGGYVVPNTNPRDLAMSGSAIAAQDTAAAAYANPSALSKLDGLSVVVGGSLIDFRSTWTDTTNTYGGGSTTMTPKAAFPPDIFAGYGGKLSNDMRWGVGAGLNIPGGGYVFWPDNWPGKNDIISVDRKVYGIYLTGGIQPIPMLRLGGGLVYYRTTEHLVQGVPLLSGEGAAEIGTAGGALSYDVSAELTPLDGIPLTIAADYKHQGVQSLSGHAHFDVPDVLRPNLLDQPATHVLTYPNRLELGAAYRVIDPLTLTFQWTWERFHVYQNDTFVGDLGTTVNVPRDYKNGYTLRLGGEYALLPMLKVRAGVLRDTSPSRLETLGPSLPDASSWAFSLGAGYEVIPGLSVDAAYFHDVQDTVVSTRPEFPGQFDTRANIFSVGLTWNMGAHK